MAGPRKDVGELLPDSIEGTITGGTPIESLVGQGLAVSNGELVVSGASGDLNTFEDLGNVNTGTLSDRPDARNAGNWYFTTDENGVFYDNGSNWQLVADHPSNIQPSDLGFNTATQEELSSHTNDTDNPHNVSTDQTGALDETGNAVDVTSIGSPSRGQRAYHDGSGDLPEGDAYYDGSNWWVDGCVAEYTPTVTLSGGQATWATSVSNDSAVFNVGVGNVTSGARVAIRKGVDGSTGNHVIDVLESGTNAGGPSVDLVVRQVKP